MVTAVPARSELAVEYTWNAPSVFPDRAAWAAELKQLMEGVDSLGQYKGHLGDGPDKLAAFIDAVETMLQRVGHVYFYAVMSQAVDSNDAEAQAMAGQANTLFARFAAAASFADPEILAIGQDRLNDWLGQEPRLKRYEHYFENLFRKHAHVRSADVEEVLGLSADPLNTVSDTSDLLINADMTFKPAVGSDGQTVEIAQGNLDKLLVSPDRELRRTAWEHYADSYLAFKNTLANNLTVAVKRDIFYTQARRYPSSLEAALFEHNIPVEVFRSLIETFKRNLPTWHRYWRVRRQALGVDTLHPYDIWAPLTTDDPVVPYDQAVDWIEQGLAPLGEQYVGPLRRGLRDDRWVDVYPNQGKRQGAFSFGWRGTHPFINMSYTDDLGSLSTLAHELGHSMHSYLAWQSQPMLISDYSIFVAEVASNFNQALVRAHLLATNDDPAFQIAVIEEAMSNFHRYFFIMPTLARFELEVHERVERGEGVTAADMNALMTRLFREGYGDEMHIDPDRVGITWAQFAHLYANYYVFQYATGIAAAHALAAPILAGEPGAAERYIRFLSAGGSLYPIDALKVAGVDMTTTAAVETAFGMLSDYVDRLEKLTAGGMDKKA